MRGIIKKSDYKSFLYSKDNIVTEIAENFINITGYSRRELIGKSLTEISCILRIDSQINLENITNECSCFMFTKEFDPKEIRISCKTIDSKKEKVYFIEQDSNISVYENFDFAKQLYTDNKTGFALYSAPDLILLKTNENYLNFLDEPYNKIYNSIGKKQKEIVTGFEGSHAEEAWNLFLATGKTDHVEEYQYDHFKRGTTYWNLSIVPIYVENNLKYILLTMLGVTEKVRNKNFLKERIKIIEEQKDQLEAIIENVSDSVYITDSKGNFKKINSKVKKFNPGSNVKFIKNKGLEFFDMLGNPITYDNLPITRALNGEVSKRKVMLVRRGDEENIIEYSATPIFNQEGNISMGALFCRDITESYNKEKIIKEQKEQLETIIENMSDELVIFDKDGQILKFNKSARNFFGCDEINNMDELYKRIQIFNMSGNLIPSENSSFSRVLKGENIVRNRIIIKTNNKIIYAESNGKPIYDRNGEFVAGIILIRDITDKLKSEETLLLKTQLDLLSNIIENLDIGFIRYSYPSLKIIDINNMAYMGLKEMNPKLRNLSSLKGLSYFEVFNDEMKINRIEFVENLIRKKGSINYNKKITFQGQEKFLKITFNPLYGLNNQVCEIIVIIVDITDEVKAKNEFEEALKVQDEIFSNISHELKTPLNVIFSTNQLMQLYLKSDLLEINKEKVIKGVNIIKQNCYRFIKIINNVIDISKIESGFFKLNLFNEDIVCIIEDILGSLSDYVKLKELNIVFDTNIEEKIIACDADKIERIILNLISNAIKFTDKGGSIYVNLYDKGDSIEIHVKDTGIGMDKKHVDNIFKRFHQIDKSLSRNAEGSGIGLSLVHSIVKLHNGKISVESRPGEGSLFKIELPSRVIEYAKTSEERKSINSKIEMIEIEFSDIYSL